MFSDVLKDGLCLCLCVSLFCVVVIKTAMASQDKLIITWALALAGPAHQNRRKGEPTIEEPCLANKERLSDLLDETFYQQPSYTAASHTDIQNPRHNVTVCRKKKKTFAFDLFVTFCRTSRCLRRDKKASSTRVKRREYLSKPRWVMTTSYRDLTRAIHTHPEAQLCRSASQPTRKMETTACHNSQGIFCAVS